MGFRTQQLFPNCSFKKKFSPRSVRGCLCCLVGSRQSPSCPKYSVGTDGEIWKRHVAFYCKIWQRHPISRARILGKSCNPLWTLLKGRGRLLGLPLPCPPVKFSPESQHLCSSRGFELTFAYGSCSSCSGQTKTAEELAPNTWTLWMHCALWLQNASPPALG